MAPEIRKRDVVVVGAGTAGSAAAVLLARSGRSVALIEARSHEEAGARWVNGVPPWMFDQAGIERPAGPEHRASGFPFTLLSHSGRARLILDPSPTWAVDVPKLTARLHDLARREGVELIDQAQVRGMEFDEGRPTAISVEREASSFTLRASLFVDASGLNAVLRRQIPELSRSCPSVPRHHLCTAAQEVSEISDPAGARRFLEENDFRPGEYLFWTGVDGGFSTMSITVSADLKEAELLTGSIADGEHATGPDLMRGLRQLHPWIGKKIFGGEGLIPLRRPYDRPAAPGIALIGNAACQVFPAHGSGTGIGLIAARVLADSVREFDDPGSLEATWGYQAAFQREYGSLLAAYDVFRRLSQSLSGGDIEHMLKAGLILKNNFIAALDEVMPGISPRDLLFTVRGAIRAPFLAARIVPRLLRMPVVAGLYRRYPQSPDLGRLRHWSHTAAALFREQPDIP